ALARKEKGKAKAAAEEPLNSDVDMGLIEDLNAGDQPAKMMSANDDLELFSEALHTIDPLSGDSNAEDELSPLKPPPAKTPSILYGTTMTQLTNKADFEIILMPPRRELHLPSPRSLALALALFARISIVCENFVLIQSKSTPTHTKSSTLLQRSLAQHWGFGALHI
ncbi:hypothetical protein HWV62_37519, partial [Athelia sp. TMB]